MKVAVLLPSLEGRGAERVGLILAEALLEAGYEVEIPVACKVGALVDHGIARTHVVDLKAPNEILCLPHLIRYLDRSQPDLLIAVIHTAKMMAGFAKKFRPSLRYIISVRHDLLQPRRRRFWLRALLGYSLERWLYKDVLAVHTVARALVPQVEQCFGIEAGRVIPIYNPIRDDPHPGAILPEHEGLFDRPVLMNAGSMVAQKNQRMLIDAFHRAGVADRVRLLILGEGPLRRKLARQVRRLGLEDSVAMPGFVMDVRPYMRRAAGFLLTSRSEGLANVLLEALGTGVPIASFDCPVGPYEILAGGRLGRLIELNDMDGLVTAIRDMADGRLHAAPPEEAEQFLAEFRMEEVKRQYVAMVQRFLPLP